MEFPIKLDKPLGEEISFIGINIGITSPANMNELRSFMRNKNSPITPLSLSDSKSTYRGRFIRGDETLEEKVEGRIIDFNEEYPYWKLTVNLNRWCDNFIKVVRGR